MTVGEVFGAAITGAGVFLGLRGSHSEDTIRVGPFRIATPVLTAVALTTTGLLVMLAVSAQPTAWWRESRLDAWPMRIGFWLGALLTIVGAATVLFGRVRSEQFAGIAVGAFGVALEFALVLDGIAFLGAAVVGATGAWLYWRCKLGLEVVLPTDPLRDTAAQASESVLTTVATVLLIWIMSGTIHHAATHEAGPSIADGTRAALPRFQDQQLSRSRTSGEARPISQ